MARITVQLYAGAAAAAGVTTTTACATTVRDLLDTLSIELGEGLARVLPTVSLLVDGIVVRDPATSLPEGATVDVLPPFAGG
jgi:molybdopterin converting factor small subunit